MESLFGDNESRNKNLKKVRATKTEIERRNTKCHKKICWFGWFGWFGFKCTVRIENIRIASTFLYVLL